MPVLAIVVIRALIFALPYLLSVAVPIVILWFANFFNLTKAADSSIFLKTFEYALNLALPTSEEFNIASLFSALPFSIQNLFGMLKIHLFIDLIIAGFITKLTIIALLKVNRGLTDATNSIITRSINQ
jgi:hypothetical protein